MAKTQSKMDCLKHLTETIVKTIYLNPYAKMEPTSKQLRFLSLSCLEAMFGGSAGAGKSISLLAGALQYVNEPGYNALIIRRTYGELSLPGALIDVGHQWLDNTKAQWSEIKKVWTFPSGATLTFGYLSTWADRMRYQGSQYSFIGFDELTQFPTDLLYLYMFSRLRRVNHSNIPLRVRSATNPGGPGHSWVKKRFVRGDMPFIPATIRDNPYLDIKQYRKSLEKLPLVEREQLLNGDWDILESAVVKPEWFQIISKDSVPDDDDEDAFTIFALDMAATPVSSANPDPDFSALIQCYVCGNSCYLLGVWTWRETPHIIKRNVRNVLSQHKNAVLIVEQEPGASGKMVIEDMQRDFSNVTVLSSPCTGSKRSRWIPLVAAAEAGNIKLVEGKWNNTFIEHIVQVEDHDDVMDAVAIAYNNRDRLRPVSIF